MVPILSAATIVTTDQESPEPSAVPNVAKRVKARRPQQSEMTYLTLSEFDALLGFVPDHYKLFVKTLVVTGMRVSEATALTGDRIDLERGTITINRAWRAATSGFELGPTKTRLSDRTIQIPATLLAELRPLVRRAGKQGFVFTNSHGDPINRRTFNDKIWRPTVNVANGQLAKDYVRGPHAGRSWDHERPHEPLGKRPRVHDLRHTHVSWALASGQALDLIRQNLGHASIRTTFDRYGHLDPSRYTEVRTALEGALNRMHEDGDYDDE